MPVSVEDVATTVGRPLSSAESAQAALWISDTGLLIAARANREHVDVSSIDPGILDMVVREAVAARIKKPDAAKQVSITVDDGQMSRTYESSTGQIEITDEWWELLFPAGQSDAFSVTLAHRPTPHHHHRPLLSQPFWDVNP